MRLEEIKERVTSFAYCSNVDGVKALAEDHGWLLERLETLLKAAESVTDGMRRGYGYNHEEWMALETAIKECRQ